MYHIELEKCKRLTPSTSKLINSFRSYDTSKTWKHDAPVIWRKCICFGWNTTSITKLSGRQTILPGNMKFYMRKCCTKCFQTQVSDFDYLNYFLNNAVIVSCKREQSYCNSTFKLKNAKIFIKINLFMLIGSWAFTCESRKL